MTAIGEATITFALDPESLATVERLERLADRLEALIPSTQGAQVDVTQSHDPFAPEGTQPAEQPETDAVRGNEPAPAQEPAPADPTPPQESAGPTEPQPEQPAPVPDPEAPDPSPSVPDPEPAAEPTPSEETPDVPAA